MTKEFIKEKIYELLRKRGNVIINGNKIEFTDNIKITKHCITVNRKKFLKFDEVKEIK